MAVAIPDKGSKMMAAWGADVARAVNALQPDGRAHGLTRSGTTGCGSEPLPANLRRPRKLRHPFEVFGETVNPAIENPALLVHIPSGSVWYGSWPLTPLGVTIDDESANLYSFNFESELTSQPATVYLVIRVNSYGTARAEFTTDPTHVQTGETIRAVLPIAVVSVDNVETEDESLSVGNVHAQHAHAPFVVGIGEEPPDPTTVYPQAFDLEPYGNGGMRCIRCICDAGACADVAVNMSYPALYLHVVRSSSTSITYAVSVDQTDRSGGAGGIFWSNGDEMQWTLYTFAGGTVSADHRPRSLGLHTIPESDTTGSLANEDQMVTAFRYDIESHCLQVKVRTLDFASYPGSARRALRSISKESDWVTVEGGECSPHTDEHPSQGSV